MLFRIALGLFLASALTLAAQQPPAGTPADQSQTARFGAGRLGRGRRRRRARQSGQARQQSHSGRLFDLRGWRSPEGRGLRALHASRRASTRRRRGARGGIDDAFPVGGEAPGGRPTDHRAGVGSTGARGTCHRVQGGPPTDSDQGAGRAGRRLPDRHDTADDPAVHDRQPSAWRGRGDARHGSDLVDESRAQAARRRRRPRASTPTTASAAEAGNTLGGISQTASIAGTTEHSRRLSRCWSGWNARTRRSSTKRRARASMLGLFALVDSLGQLPGRKTVFYFCEGLTIPDSQQAGFVPSSTPPTTTTSASTRSTRRVFASTARSSRPPARCAS